MRVSFFFITIVYMICLGKIQRFSTYFRSSYILGTFLRLYIEGLFFFQLRSYICQRKKVQKFSTDFWSYNVLRKFLHEFYLIVKGLLLFRDAHYDHRCYVIFGKILRLFLFLTVRTLEIISLKLHNIHWNLSSSSCSNAENFNVTFGFNKFSEVNCDCSFSNNSVCHVTRMYDPLLLFSYS